MENKKINLTKWIISLPVILLELFSSVVFVSEYIDYEDKFIVKSFTTNYVIANKFLVFASNQVQNFVDILNNFPQIMFLVLGIIFFMAGLMHILILAYDLKPTILYTILKSVLVTSSITTLYFYTKYITKLNTPGDDLLANFRLFKIYLKVAYEKKIEYFITNYKMYVNQSMLLTDSEKTILNSSMLKQAVANLPKELVDKLTSGELVKRAKILVETMTKSIVDSANEVEAVLPTRGGGNLSSSMPSIEIINNTNILGSNKILTYIVFGIAIIGLIYLTNKIYWSWDSVISRQISENVSREELNLITQRLAEKFAESFNRLGLVITGGTIDIKVISSVFAEAIVDLSVELARNKAETAKVAADLARALFMLTNGMDPTKGND